jgi:hypothetical protein
VPSLSPRSLPPLRRSRSTFESTPFSKGIPYWVFWYIFGICGLDIIGLWAYYNDDNVYLITLFCVAVLIFVIPLAIGIIRSMFFRMLLGVQDCIWSDPDDFRIWFEMREPRIYTLSRTWSRMMSIPVFALCIFSYAYEGRVYSSLVLNVALSAYLVVMFMICSQSSYVVTDMMFTLWDLTRKVPNLPFVKPIYIVARQILNVYLLMAMFVVVGYITVVAMIYYGPYGVSAILFAWLSVLAVFPIAVIILSLFFIHAFMVNGKEHQIEMVNLEIQSSLHDLTSNRNSGSIERMDKLMDIQLKTEGMREWPIAISGVAAFIIALIPALIQIAVAVF